MNRGFCLIRQLVSFNLRVKNYSTLPPEVVIHLDKDTIVCWHPEQPFPYECSKPLPERKESNAVLKVGFEEVNEMFRQTTPQAIAEELAKITQTTKHRWFPRSRDKRAKKTNPDRKYL